ncbi:c6 zinc finger protein [Moniliophthora roreri]|nr:c6 zinc finger protein [Moniliophthora roreri]
MNPIPSLDLLVPTRLPGTHFGRGYWKSCFHVLEEQTEEEGDSIYRFTAHRQIIIICFLPFMYSFGLELGIRDFDTNEDHSPTHPHLVMKHQIPICSWRRRTVSPFRATSGTLSDEINSPCSSFYINYLEYNIHKFRAVCQASCSKEILLTHDGSQSLKRGGMFYERRVVQIGGKVWVGQRGSERMNECSVGNGNGGRREEESRQLEVMYPMAICSNNK